MTIRHHLFVSSSFATKMRSHLLLVLTVTISSFPQALPLVLGAARGVRRSSVTVSSFHQALPHGRSPGRLVAGQNVDVRHRLFASSDFATSPPGNCCSTCSRHHLFASSGFATRRRFLPRGGRSSRHHLFASSGFATASSKN